MGIVQQGRRDKDDAEYRRDTLDFQKEQFEYRKGQDVFDNVVTAVEKGMDPSTVPGFEGVPGDAVKSIQRNHQMTQNRVKVVDAFQNIADSAYYRNPEGADFSQEEADQFASSLSPILNPTGRSDFEMAATAGPEGMFITVDPQTYEQLGQSIPELAKMMRVSGADASDDVNAEGGSSPITRQNIQNLLAREIAAINRNTPGGASAYTRSMTNYKGSAATSTRARIEEIDNDRTRLLGQIGSMSASLPQSVGRIINRSVDDASMLPEGLLTNVTNQFAEETTAEMNRLATRANEAKTAKEIQDVSTDMAKFRSAVQARASTAINNAVADAQVIDDLPTWEQEGVFNRNTADLTGSKWSKRDNRTLEEVEQASQNASHSIRGSAEREAREAYFAANGRTDAASTDLTAKLNKLEADIYNASATGALLDADSYLFMRSYASEMLEQLQDSGVNVFAERAEQKGIGGTPAASAVTPTGAGGLGNGNLIVPDTL
jgi:hypothetical protein